ncbi:MAG: hypothetical protein JSU61_00115, partial [Fidelibacterota bacterium]
MKRTGILAMILTASLIQSGWGAIPRTMSYQGVLNDASGNPVANGSYSITFTVYDSLGSSQWSKNLSVQVTGGLFSVILGKTSPLPDPFPEKAELGINVEGTDMGTQALTATPYSLASRRAAVAANADSLGQSPAAAYALDNEVGSIVLANDGHNSGLDADLLDGQHGSYYRDADLLDGQDGSYYRDADLLDGQHGSYYRDAGSIISGQLGTAYFSAFTDLANEFKLNNDDTNDLLTRGQSDTRYWMSGGNSLTTTGIFGSSTNYAIDFRVNNARALRLEPNGTSPNVIGGYSGNTVAVGIYGAVIGGGGSSGQVNQVSDIYGTIGGGVSNTVSNNYGTLGGGYNNGVSGQNATVAGGDNNNAIGTSTAICGGSLNSASNTASTIGGGYSNTANNSYATVAGGTSNLASGIGAAVGGGIGNTASGQESAVGGGSDNEASGSQSTVGGGEYNKATQVYSTVPGGVYNEATGQSSFAAGTNAHADDNYAVVIAATSDMVPTPTYAVYSGGQEQMVLRADGGLYITNIAETAPSSLNIIEVKQNSSSDPVADAWTTYSSRRWKTNIQPIEGAL